MRVGVGGLHWQCFRQLEGTRSFLEPETLLCGRAHHPLGVRLALGVVIAGEGLLNPPRTARFQGMLAADQLIPNGGGPGRPTRY
jgi:hypothetical protein